MHASLTAPMGSYSLVGHGKRLSPGFGNRLCASCYYHDPLVDQLVAGRSSHAAHLFSSLHERRSAAYTSWAPSPSAGQSGPTTLGHDSSTFSTACVQCGPKVHSAVTLPTPRDHDWSRARPRARRVLVLSHHSSSVRSGRGDALGLSHRGVCSVVLLCNNHSTRMAEWTDDPWTFNHTRGRAGSWKISRVEPRSTCTLRGTDALAGWGRSEVSKTRVGTRLTRRF